MEARGPVHHQELFRICGALHMVRMFVAVDLMERFYHHLMEIHGYQDMEMD